MIRKRTFELMESVQYVLCEEDAASNLYSRSAWVTCTVSPILYDTCKHRCSLFASLRTLLYMGAFGGEVEPAQQLKPLLCDFGDTSAFVPVPSM